MTCRLSLYQFTERLNKRWMDSKYLKCAKREKKNPDFRRMDRFEWTGDQHHLCVLLLRVTLWARSNRSSEPHRLSVLTAGLGVK